MGHMRFCHPMRPLEARMEYWRPMAYLSQRNSPHSSPDRIFVLRTQHEAASRPRQVFADRAALFMQALQGIEKDSTLLLSGDLPRYRGCDLEDAGFGRRK